MKRIFSAFTPGVRVLLALLGGCYVAALIGRHVGFDLYSWLALSSRAFWSGAVWQAVSYTLLPAGLTDFLINGLMLVMLGIYVERVWSKKELWVYCIVCVAGAGLAKVLLQPSSPVLMVGTTSVVLGLLVACARLFAGERMLLMGIWNMSVRTMALLMTILTLVTMFLCAGLLNTLIMLSGGVSGWIFLTVRWKIIGNRPCTVVNSERIGRLEL
jgi:membrane associated rhomboid family serine protease